MNEVDLLNEITEIYVSYLSMMPDKKIDAGDSLNKAGSLLLSINTDKLDHKYKIHQSYLTKKVASDLLHQAGDMAYTKKYDLSQIPKKLTYLAYELACDYYDNKPYKELIPYLTAVISYEKYNHDQSQYELYKDILKECIKDEEKFLRILKEI